jgi:hypothetical protein
MVHPGEHGLEEAPAGGGGDQPEGAPLGEQWLEVPAGRGCGACQQAEGGGCGDGRHEMDGRAERGFAG